MTESSFPFTAVELEDLRYAKSLLERPTLTAKLSSMVGGPIEAGFKILPKDWSGTVNRAVRTGLFKALEVATMTMGSRQRRASSQLLHKVMVGASGSFGGAFGLPALMIELPISTTIMMRSIADIARSEGHDVTDPLVKMNCLEVFALGGRVPNDDSAESAYFAVRAALSKAVSEAAAYLAEKGVAEKSAPAILRFVSTVAARFGVVVSEQVAAKAVPVIGAAGGALVNVIFMNHFQDMAKGHFIVKRLEKLYGEATVRAAYDRLVVRIQR